MITLQQRWNRYVNAINFCLEMGYFIDCVHSKDSRGDWNGNIKGIKVRKCISDIGCVIMLKPKRYKPIELYTMIVEKIGCP